MSVRLIIRDFLDDVVFDLNIEGKLGKLKMRNEFEVDGEVRVKNGYVLGGYL